MNKICLSNLNKKIRRNLTKIGYDSKEIEYCIYHRIPLIAFNCDKQLYLKFIDIMDNMLNDNKYCYLILERNNFLLDCKEYYLFYEKTVSPGNHYIISNFKTTKTDYGNRYTVDCYRYCDSDIVKSCYTYMDIVNGSAV